MEAIIEEATEEIALRQRRFAVQDIRDEVARRIRLENARRSEGEQLRCPSLRTLQRRVALLAEFDLTAARTSTKEAERKFALHSTARAVSRLLECVEIDHSPIDLMVVGSDRLGADRPTITVVLDRASRCVLGYHLSLSGHGVPAVFEALRHALLPKLYLSTTYADLGLTWECFGWMERVLMDNGREFHADAVADALLNLGIICEFAKSRTPNDKPYVERFLRTLNYGLIHRLKGTTLDKAHKRVGFNPEKDAAITLEELDRIIHIWICNKYHLRPHRGLDMRAPIDVWRDLAKVNPPQLKMNSEDVDIEFSEHTDSRLQTYGIDLNTFVYRSPQLLLLHRLLPKSGMVTVKWPRNDVGHIWVWDFSSDKYIKVPNTKQEYAGLTLEQAKAAKRAKASGDQSYAQVAAEAGAIIRGMVEEGDKATKLARRRATNRLANRTSADARGSEHLPVEMMDQAPADVDHAKDLPVPEIEIELPDTGV